MGPFARLHSRLKEKQEDVRAKPVIVVAMGDSVTQGCMEYNTIEHDEVYHQLLKKHLERAYPNTIVSVINSGVSGDTVVRSAERWQRDVIAYDPDLVIVGFGVNDAHGGQAGLQPYIDGLLARIADVRSLTKADILILTPNMMIQADNSNVHEKDRVHVPNFLRVWEDGRLQLYVDALRKLVSEEKLPHVDIYAMFEELKRDGVDIHTRLANGINHPDRVFHRAIAQAIYERLGTA